MYNVISNNLHMQSYKDASSLSNKPLSYFDELAIIFGKDQETRDGTKFVGESMEAIKKREFNTYNSQSNF